MFLTYIVLAFAAAALAALAFMAMRDHRRELRLRAALLDAVTPEFPDSRAEIGPDGFPSLRATLPDGCFLDVGLLADSLVMRRLPQLWLIVTIREREEVPRPSLGALARPTGAEFYSRVMRFPDRLRSPANLDAALLFRGEGNIGAAALHRVGGALDSLFRDASLKEIAATPRGIRVVRQASEGDRGAHLLLRQMRFSLSPISLALVARCLADADVLRQALDMAGDAPIKLSA